MRLPYFPAFYRDELLYSALGRWSRHAGVTSPSAAAEALFGNSHAVASFDLPGNLAALADRLPIGYGMSVDALISTGTLEPYYTAFCSLEVRESVRSAMRAGDVSGLHAKLGISASRVPRPKGPRYCLECLRDAAAAHGEYYWRRSHQLPGVVVCVEHGCSLTESPALFSGLSRHGYLVADPVSCPESGRRCVLDFQDAMLKPLVALSVASAKLLTDPPRPVPLDDWGRRYRDLARDRGLMLTPKRVDVRALVDGFRDRFGCIASVVSCLDPRADDGGWLVSMLRAQRKSAQPLHHLATRLYLEALPRPAGVRAAAGPFGPGPWPCRNPLAAHRGEAVVQDLKWYRNKGPIVGVFQCDCGYRYTRGIDGQGNLGAPRYRSYGPMLAPVLRAAVSRGETLRSLGRRLELDPKTVVMEALTLGLEIPWTCAGTRTCRTTREPAARKTAHRRTSRQLTDWTTRDREEVVRVRHAAGLILSENPPVRVTVAEVERRLGRRDWFRRRRLRMPVVTQVVAKLVEPLEEFQHRRLRWAVQRVLATGKNARAWKVLKIAGLKPVWHERAERALADAVRNPAQRAA